MTPPFVDPKRWRVLVDVCRQMDDRYHRTENVTAPPRKDAGR